VSSFVSTVTRTTTTTMTAARVRTVMLEVNADFVGVAVAGLAAYDKWMEWNADLSFLLEKEAVRSFQLQFTCQGYAPVALEYTVSADGTLQSNDKAGGIDYFALAEGSRASLFVSLNYESLHIETVMTYLREHGWRFNGQAVSGNGTRDRVYSTDGYGVTRNKIGTW
jgi:hypothetical protein